MVFRFTEIAKTRKSLRKSPSTWNQAPYKGSGIPKGYFAVYAGESQKKRIVIPISLLKEPSFQHLLSQAEEEFDYGYPMGGITISCLEDVFFNLISCSYLAHILLKCVRMVSSLHKVAKSEAPKTTFKFMSWPPFNGNHTRTAEIGCRRASD